MREITDPELLRHIQNTKDQISKQCRSNIDRIHQKCAYEGESFSDHKECYDASKEWLRYGGFPSCKSN
jgi:hypothetical protein